jgi:hypothetical protein
MKQKAVVTAHNSRELATAEARPASLLPPLRSPRTGHPFVPRNESSWAIQERFQHSGETVHRYFCAVLQALVCLHEEVVLQEPTPLSEQAARAREDTDEEMKKLWEEISSAVRADYVQKSQY